MTERDCRAAEREGRGVGAPKTGWAPFRGDSAPSAASRTSEALVDNRARSSRAVQTHDCHDCEMGAAPGTGVNVTELFKNHHGFVFRVLVHLGVAAADRSDALQEVFMVVHRRAPEYRDQDKPRAWLYAIAARVARDYRRRAHRRRESFTATAPEQVQPANQSTDLATREALALAQRLLAALPPKQREVFLLFEVEQMPMPEVAAAVGCALATAHARLRLARARVLGLASRVKLRGDAP